MSNFGTGQNIFAAAATQNKDQNPSNPGSTPAGAGGGLFGNFGANTTSSTAFGGAGAGGASAPSGGAPGPGTSGGFSGAGAGLFGGGANANANAPNPTGAGANASPFGFAKPTNAGGSLFGTGSSGLSNTNASGPTGGIMGGGGGGGGGSSLFSGLGSQPKTGDAPAPTASPFGSLPGGSLFPKAPGAGTPATTATTNTQPQPAFSLGGATLTGDKTAPAAAPASQCQILLVTALANHNGPQQVAGPLRALVPPQTKMESLRKRKTALLVRPKVALLNFSLTSFLQHQPCPHSPLVGSPQAQHQPLQHPQQRKRTVQLPHVGGLLPDRLIIG